MKSQKIKLNEQIGRLALFLIIPLTILAMVMGCKKDDDDPEPIPTDWQAANSTCVTSDCHGNQNLKKDITVTGGAVESVPLYVDSAAFLTTVHKTQLCTSCHTDIIMTKGSHGPATKSFGGWARFSTKSGTKTMATTDSTRNYSTEASQSCNACHPTQYNANSAHIKIPRLKGASIRDFGGHPVGEAYEDNNCSRCHATCGTCHFESDITPKVPTHADLLIQSNWDGVQTLGDNYNGVNWGDATEWRMDWTANVRTHNFRSAETLNSSNDVCRSCHIGFYRPPQVGYTMREGTVDSMYATGVKRHPQFQELSLGSIHQNTTCGTCHGGSLHQQVNITQGPECIDCHAGKDASHPAINHMNLSGGVKIKCIACHTSHRASDFNGSGQSNWINSEIVSYPEIGPVVVKYNELLNWYPHYMSKTVNCAALCHFEGNRVGAHTIADKSIPNRPKVPYIVPTHPGESDE